MTRHTGLLVLFLLFSCTSMKNGVLYDRSGNPLPETPVRLVTIDDEGNERTELAETVTDAYGNFQFDLGHDTNASTVLVADLVDGPIRGFYAGRTGLIPIHPLTDVLYTLVTDITSSPEERSLTDFSSGELREIADALFAWDFSSIPYTETERLFSTARIAVGRKIALAAGGTIATRTTAELEGTETTSDVTFAPNSAICPIGEEIRVLDSSSFRFDIQADGTLCGGTSSTLPDMFYDKAFQMILQGETFYNHGGSVFPVPVSTPAAALFEGDREIALGPYSLVVPISSPAEEDTITVARKVYVPVFGDYARFLEIFTNSGTEDRAVSLEIPTYLTTTNLSAILAYDRESPGFDRTARFFSVFDFAEDRPTAGFVFQDGLGTFPLTDLSAPQIAGGEVNEVRYYWTRFHIPAGTTRTFVHYALLMSSRLYDDSYNALETMAERPDMTGMSRLELAGLMNFTPALGTVYGDAGSVIGLATVIATNERTYEALTVTARRDGSFAIPIDAQSGDAIRVTASDGLDMTSTVP